MTNNGDSVIATDKKNIFDMIRAEIMNGASIFDLFGILNQIYSIFIIYRYRQSIKMNRERPLENENVNENGEEGEEGTHLQTLLTAVH